MKNFNVGVIGATGMVGQRLITLLDGHPWFKVTTLAASSNSAGKKYSDLVSSRWAMSVPVPKDIENIIVKDALASAEEIASQVDFVFCAVDMNKDDVKKLEEMYAKLECPVISNNSANRTTPDVPMIIPEVNPEHTEIIHTQRKRLGTKKGFIAVKSNCSIQSYVPALEPLKKFGLKNVLACTYQAISGAGKTFETWPEMVDNVIPFIGGEEEKSETEPLKVWGKIKGEQIIDAVSPSITAQCFRVAAQDGHMAAVFASFESTPTIEEIKACWKEFKGFPQEKNLPSAPKQFLTYFEENDRPQTRLDRDLENGMGISLGRVRKDASGQYDIKFTCLSHNTVRGAAGGGILMAELLAEKGFLD